MSAVNETRAHLIETAARYPSHDGATTSLYPTGGDVVAAALRYTAALISTWGYADLVRDLEKVAQGAEEAGK